MQSVDGRAVKNGEAIRAILQTKSPGDSLRVELLRGEKPLALWLTLAP